MALVADVAAVLTLADGTEIFPDGSNSKQKKRVEIPSNSKAKQIVFNANKRLADLPSLPAQMNTMSVVLTYSLWGLVDQDIAIATGLTIEQINNIRAQDVYHKLKSDLLDQIKAADEDKVRSAINQNSERAINRVTELMNSDDEKVALKASTDILDRAGHRPADIVEHRHMLSDTFKIEIIRKTDKEVPMIDITPIEVEE